MITNPYDAQVRKLFAAPAHAGDLADAEVVSIADQDVRLQLAATTAGGAVQAMRFRAWGCPHLIAATEAACAALEGQAVANLVGWTAAGIMQNLAVPVEKTGRILVLEDTVRLLGRRIGGGT